MHDDKTYFLLVHENNLVGKYFLTILIKWFSFKHGMTVIWYNIKEISKKMN